jgi:hypothetical protein
MKDQLVGWGVLAGIVLAWLFIEPALPFGSETTVYLGWCPAGRVNGVCQKGEEVGDPVTYKAVVDAQAIMYFYPNQPPNLLHGCAVRDARNWSCSESEGVTIAMVDGKLAIPRSSLTPSFYQVPKWRWYWVSLHTKTFWLKFGQ